MKSKQRETPLWFSNLAYKTHMHTSCTSTHTSHIIHNVSLHTHIHAHMHTHMSFTRISHIHTSRTYTHLTHTHTHIHTHTHLHTSHTYMHTYIQVTFFNFLDAVRWCIAVQRALLQAEWPESILTLPFSCKKRDKSDKLIFNGIRIRMGIHTGFPNCRRNPVTGRMDYYGKCVNKSARISDSAHGGQIICTNLVHTGLKEALVSKECKEDIIIKCLGAHSYKGIKEPVSIYQITPKDLFNRKFPALRHKDTHHHHSKTSSSSPVMSIKKGLKNKSSTAHFTPNQNHQMPVAKRLTPVVEVVSSNNNNATTTTE